MIKIEEKLKKKILETIKPTREEEIEIKKEINNFINSLEKASKELSIEVEFKIGGSFGKGTYLKNKFDVDIFSRFPLKYNKEDISILLKKIIDKAKINYRIEKGSRNYYSGFFGTDFKFNFELIPVLKIDKIDLAENSTDLSPFHVDFVLNKIKENPALSDEIRLSKIFFKANNLYGAESYINGFSGHVIDCLLIKFKSLENLLNNVINWGEIEIIDINNFYENNNNALEKIPSSKRSNLILIDPIIKERNAARALSKKNYYNFIYLTKSLNIKNNLSEENFIIKEINSDKFIKLEKEYSKKILSDLIIYELELGQIQTEDITGSKLKKLLSKIDLYYRDYDFIAFKKEFYINFKEKKAIFTMHFNKKKLLKYKKINGPSIFLEDAFNKFIQIHPDSFQENGRLYYFKERKYLKLSEIPQLKINDLKKMHTRKLDVIERVNFYFFEF